MAKPELNAVVAAARERVIKARELAELMRSDDRLYRLSMETVFVLEDVFVTLKFMAEGSDGSPSAGTPAT